MRERLGHIPGEDISTVLGRFGNITSGYNWLIVALDSSRAADLRNSREMLGRRFGGLSGKLSWREEGLWMRGSDVLGAVADGLFVPFSAVYVFAVTVTSAAVPDYSLTSESEQFGEASPSEVLVAAKRIGAIGYLADGCGLNYYLADDALYEALTKGE